MLKLRDGRYTVFPTHFVQSFAEALMKPSQLATLPEDILRRVLKRLSYRQREMLKLVSGVADGFQYTAEEVAHIFRTDERRVRAIVSHAMRQVVHFLDEGNHENEASSQEASGLLIHVAIPEYCDEDFVTEKLVELYDALDGMHRGAGGSGLTVNRRQSCGGAITLSGAPIP